jgi:hypothetical protein
VVEQVPMLEKVRKTASPPTHSAIGGEAQEMEG